MLITFSGLDGAGKSTLIEAARSELARRRLPVAVLHLNDHVGIYAALRRIRDGLLGRAPDVAAPPRIERHPSGLGRVRDGLLWSATVRRVLYPLDLLIFWGYRRYHETVRRRILIMDRYFYDRLVDVATQRGWGWLRLLARLTPTPDLPIFLEISAEAAFARKGEYTVPYLRRRGFRYHKVLSWIPTALRVRADDLDAARHVVTRAVCQRVTRAAPSEAAAGATLLGLLLERPRADAAEIDWSLMPEVAERNRLAVRVMQRLEERGERPPPAVAAVARRAATRRDRMLDLVSLLGDQFARRGIAHVFLRVAERYPDMGGDVDLLVQGPPDAVDRIVRECRCAVRRSRDFTERVSGCVTYDCPDHELVLDVHLGRLGRLGEHTELPAMMLRRGRRVRLGAHSCMAPAPEDALLLEALHRMFGRPVLRPADLLWTIETVRGGLRWDMVFETAQRTHLLGSLSYYLRAVDDVHRRVLGGGLLERTVRDRLPRIKDRTTERNGSVALSPGVPVHLYWESLLGALRAGDWRRTGRLCLLPALGGAVGWRRALGAVGR